MIKFDDYPDQFDFMEGDTEDFKITIQNANPIPTIEWLVGSHKLDNDDIEIVHDGTPRNRRSAGSSFYQTIRYTANFKHNGQQLSVVVKQTDENGNVLEQNFPVTTFFVAVPIIEEPKTLGVGIIAVIVSIACFILLALILLFIAFRTGRFCFKNATHTVLVKEVEAPRPDQNSMETQANMSTGVECGVGADFAPPKPSRTYSRDQLDNISGENVPLISNEKTQGKAISIVATAGGKAAGKDASSEEVKKLEAMLSGSEDELKRYEYEGNESICTSLSSINTDVPEEDWEETFRALGPKFHRLADLVGGKGDESDTDEENEKTDVVCGTKDNGTQISTSLSSYKHTASYTMSSTRKYIQTVNIKQSSSIQHYSQDSQTDSGVSNTPSSGVNGGGEESSEGTEI